MRTLNQRLDDVRLLLTPAVYQPEEARWLRAATEDGIALDKAMKDLRARLAHRRDPVRDPAAWLFRAWVGQRRVQLQHEGSAR